MAPRIDIVGLGPADFDLTTVHTTNLITTRPTVLFRTVEHPAVQAFDEPVSFDHVYESEQTFDAVYNRIVAELIEVAVQAHNSGSEPPVYVVPGSPAVAEHTVELLIAHPDIQTTVHPALSFIDLAWVRLGIDPVACGAKIIDGHQLDTQLVGTTGPALIAQCSSQDILSNVKLSVDDFPDQHVTILHHLGLPDEQVLIVPWEEMDRTIRPDHLTSLWVPEFGVSSGSALDSFSALVSDLIDADPWKLEQTHESLIPFLLEEAEECATALRDYDPYSGEGSNEVVSELGDVLYQVVFHSVLGQQDGWFTLADVISGIDHKLQSRHEFMKHIDITDAASAQAAWQQAKEHESDTANDEE